MRCRLWLVQRHLARRKHSTVTEGGKNVLPVLLLSGIIVSSGVLGFLLGDARLHTPMAYALEDNVPRLAILPAHYRLDKTNQSETTEPQLMAARPTQVEADFASAQAIIRSDKAADLIPEIGHIHAQILRLRILFARLAEVAELDDGEFDLDVPLVLPTTVFQAAETQAGASEQSEPLSELKFPKIAKPTLARSIAALDQISTQSDRMSSIFYDRRLANAQRVSGRPVQQGRISSGFGRRQNPISGANRMHHGLDYSGNVGEPVRALADGIVTYSGVNGGYGNLVELEHSDGFHTRYAHNEENLVRVGQRVRKGVVVATLGSTGQSTGPHVHVEVRQHQLSVDPAFFLR